MFLDEMLEHTLKRAHNFCQRYHPCEKCNGYGRKMTKSGVDPVCLACQGVGYFRNQPLLK